MSNLRDAADIIAKFAEAMKTQIEQVDVVLCETGDDVGLYAWTAKDDCAFAFISLPFRINSNDDLLHSEWSQAVMDALPADLIARAR